MNRPTSGPLLIVGASARAAAMSAIGAGFEPWGIDLFGDRDWQDIAPVRVCPMDRYPQAIAEIARSWVELPQQAPLLLTGAMENHLDVVAELAKDHPLLGSTISAIGKTRSENLWRSWPKTPEMRYPWPEEEKNIGQGWILKPRLSGGGRKVRRCASMPATIDADFDLQAFVPGLPISAIYADDSFPIPARRSNDRGLLGVTRQLIGEKKLGGRDFLFCGNVAPCSLSEKQRSMLENLGHWIMQTTGLRSIFGVDLILSDDDVLWPIEINPRYTASVEVIELLTKWPAVAKGIYHAKRNATVPDLSVIALNHAFLADIPIAGTFVASGQPVCSILAHGDHPDQAMKHLYQAAESIAPP